MTEGTKENGTSDVRNGRENLETRRLNMWQYHVEEDITLEKHTREAGFFHCKKQTLKRESITFLGT